MSFNSDGMDDASFDPIAMALLAIFDPDAIVLY